MVTWVMDASMWALTSFQALWRGQGLSSLSQRANPITQPDMVSMPSRAATTSPTVMWWAGRARRKPPRGPRTECRMPSWARDWRILAR